MTTERRLVGAIALTGVALQLLLVTGALLEPGVRAFGTHIYDYYFLALADGRFDIPVRVASLEGHFTPDGRAYVYHGIAPVLSRLFLWPFVDLRTAATSWLSVFLFSVAGTVGYHLLFDRIVVRFGPAQGPTRRTWRAWVAAAVWLCGPGLLLAASDSLFHEPIAVAYCCAAWSLVLLSRVVLFGARPVEVLIPLTVLAGVALHARPHVAVGLYLACGLLVVRHLAGEGWSHAGRVAAGVAVLGGFGLGLLGVNAARFGNPLQVMGSMDASEVQYGFSYWGIEDPDSPRLRAMREHGRFNLLRLPANLTAYAVDAPVTPVSELVGAAHAALSAPVAPIRVEPPHIGVLFLWTPWLALALIGLRLPGVEARWRHLALVAGGTGAFFMLSYATVTFRYRIDVWPLVAAVAMLALPRLMHAVREERVSAAARGVLTASLLCAAVVSVIFAGAYNGAFEERGLYGTWNEPTCQGLFQRRGMPPEAVFELCRLPLDDGGP